MRRKAKIKFYSQFYVANSKQFTFKLPNKLSNNIKLSIKQSNKTVQHPSAAELLIEFGHIVVPLRLVEVAGNRITKMVLGSKLGHRLTATTSARTVCQMRLREAQFSALLVEQEHIAMKTYSQDKTSWYRNVYVPLNTEMSPGNQLQCY